MIRVTSVIAILIGCAGSAGDGRAELAMARKAVTRGEARAIALYDAVPRFSAAWPRALFEESREQARHSGYSRALGLLFTLRAPQLADWVFPEAYALEADIYVRNCYYGRALAIAKRFRSEVLPLRAMIGTRPADPRSARWLATRADDLDALRIEIDNAADALDQVEEVARTHGAMVVDNELIPTSESIIVVDGNTQRWPFDGTFWPDELGFYRIRIRSACTPRRAEWSD